LRISIGKIEKVDDEKINLFGPLDKKNEMQNGEEPEAQNKILKISEILEQNEYIEKEIIDVISELKLKEKEIFQLIGQQKLRNDNFSISSQNEPVFSNRTHRPILNPKNLLSHINSLQKPQK